MKHRHLTSRTWPTPYQGVEIHVVVRLPLEGAAYVGYSREQIEALLEGIGKVVVAAERAQAMGDARQ